MLHEGVAIPGFMGSRLSWATDWKLNKRTISLHTHDKRESESTIDSQVEPSPMNYQLDFLSEKENIRLAIQHRNFLWNPLEVVLKNEEKVLGVLQVSGTITSRVYNFRGVTNMSLTATALNVSHQEIRYQILGQNAQDETIAVADLLYKIGTEEVLYNFSKIHNCDTAQLQLFNSALTGISIVMMHDASALSEYIERESIQHKAMEILLI